MQINSVKAYNFSGSKGKRGYENPISGKTEKNLAALASVGTGLLAGATAFGLSTCVTSNKKTAGIIGALAGGLTIALTLPSAIYNAKVGSFTREKEMDVFSKQKEVQKNIYGGISEETNTSLDDAVNHYTKVAMAEKGKGLMIQA